MDEAWDTEDDADTQVILVDLKVFCQMFPELRRDPIWMGFQQPIRLSEIRRAAQELRSNEGSLPTTAYNPEGRVHWSRAEHIRRCAYLLVHGWDDPVEMDVGCPSLGTPTGWPLQDGHHRTLAALARGDKSILASVAGEEEIIEKLRYKEVTP